MRKKIYVVHVPWVKVLDFLDGQEIEGMWNVNSSEKIIEIMNFWEIQNLIAIAKACKYIIFC